MESLNSPSLVGVMITERRQRVVDALGELAKNAQSKLASGQDDVELENFAFALAWQYARLSECTHLDKLVEKAAEKRQKADSLKQSHIDLQPRVEALMSEVKNLDQYVRAQPGRVVNPLGPKHPRDELMNGTLGPASVAGLVNRIPQLSAIDLVEGAIRLLNEAPWRRKLKPISSEYFAIPSQRLDFLAACQALLPEAEKLRKALLSSPKLVRALEEANCAEKEIDVAWSAARRDEPFPPTLGRMVREVLRNDSPAAASPVRRGKKA